MTGTGPILGNRVTKAVAQYRFNAFSSSCSADMSPMIALVKGIAFRNDWQHFVDIDDPAHVLDDIDRWVDDILDGDEHNKPFDDDEIVQFRKKFCGMFGYRFNEHLRAAPTGWKVEPIDEGIGLLLLVVSGCFESAEVEQMIRTADTVALQQYSDAFATGVRSEAFQRMVAQLTLRDEPSSPDVPIETARAADAAVRYLHGTTRRLDAIAEIIKNGEQLYAKRHPKTT